MDKKLSQPVLTFIQAETVLIRQQNNTQKHFYLALDSTLD